MSESGYISGAELLGTADGLHVAGEGKREIRDNPKIYGLNNGKNGAASDRDGEDEWWWGGAVDS